MDTCEVIRNRILSLLEEYQMSIHSLAIKSGIAPSTIKNILYGKSTNPGIVTIKLICDGFGISLNAFFNTPEFSSTEMENI